MKFAVFGHPVSGSKSPAIHARFAEAAGLDVEYRAIDCPAGTLSAALDAFRAVGGSGCNLTVPLKSEGLALAASATAAARDAGACNTLVAAEDGWHADNTDGAGLMADFDRLGIEVADRRVLLLGAGGAVAGILGPLLGGRPACVRVVNRNVARAERLVARFPGHGRLLDFCGSESMPDQAEFDLVIQGTSLGHQGSCPRLKREWLAPDAVGYDLNYGPAFAPFAARCGELGIACHTGLGMLVEQAALAFELFTGTKPETGSVRAALVE